MTSKSKALSIREWWGEVGTENVKKVAAATDTTLAYMRHLSYRSKRPGYDLMVAIIEAANTITPGFAPDLTVCMQPIKKRKPNPNYSPAIKPSKAFMRTAGKAVAQ